MKLRPSTQLYQLSRSVSERQSTLAKSHSQSVNLASLCVYLFVYGLKPSQAKTPPPTPVNKCGKSQQKLLELCRESN